MTRYRSQLRTILRIRSRMFNVARYRSPHRANRPLGVVLQHPLLPLNRLRSVRTQEAVMHLACNAIQSNCWRRTCLPACIRWQATIRAIRYEEGEGEGEGGKERTAMYTLELQNGRDAVSPRRRSMGRNWRSRNHTTGESLDGSLTARSCSRTARSITPVFE